MARIVSVDAFRVPAIVAVLVIHSHYYRPPGEYSRGEWVAAAVLDQLSRFAVPFFFFVSGYFLGLRRARGGDATAAAMAQAKRLFALFLVWSLIFVLWDGIRMAAWDYRPAGGASIGSTADFGEWVRASAGRIFTGVRIQLWFLPALCMGMLLVCAGEGMGRWGFGGVAVTLFLIGLAAGPYAPLTGLSLGMPPRNGPFFSTLFVYLGFRAGCDGWRPTTRQALLLIVGGLGLHGLEVSALAVRLGANPFAVDYVLGTAFVALGVGLLALAKPELGAGTTLPALGRLTLGVYLVHVDIEEAVAGLNPVGGLGGQLLLVAVSFAASLALVALIARTRLRWLVT